MTRKWSCARCGVVASFSSQGTGQEPEGWERQGREWRCLNCRREEAMDVASTETDSEGKRLRRRALIEFELLRDPEATDQLVAKRARCSAALVAPVRAELRDARKLPGG
jgi:hypothetical protein